MFNEMLYKMIQNNQKPNKRFVNVQFTNFNKKELVIAIG